MDEQLLRLECLKVAASVARHYTYPMLIKLSDKLVEWAKTGETPDFTPVQEDSEKLYQV